MAGSLLWINVISTDADSHHLQMEAVAGSVNLG